MPTAWIPTQLRELTQGKQTITVSGKTVREVIKDLESQFPGIKERLCDGDRVRANISVVVDGHVAPLKIREKVNEDSEINFVIAISGG